MSKLKLIFVGQRNYFGHHVDTPHGMEVEFIDWAVRRDSPARLHGLAADLIFVFRGELIPPEIVGSWRGRTVHLSTEPMPRFVGGRVQSTPDRAQRLSELMRGPTYDYLLHFDPTSIGYLNQAGLKVAGAFSLPVAQRWFDGRRARRPRWQVFLLGRQTSYRDHLTAPLRHALGDAFLHVAHGYSAEEICAAASKSALALNLHTDDCPSIEPRLALLMATGVPVISEPLSHDDLYAPGQHYIRTTGHNLAATIYHWLERPAEAELIGSQASQHVGRYLNAKLYWSKLAETLLAN